MDPGRTRFRSVGRWAATHLFGWDGEVAAGREHRGPLTAHNVQAYLAGIMAKRHGLSAAPAVISAGRLNVKTMAENRAAWFIFAAAQTRLASR